MNLRDINESKPLQPNNWNQLLALLDKLFNLGQINNSTVKRRKQWFDQKSGEHVILLEYRVKVANQAPIKSPPPKVKLTPNQK
jgi:hypothetical protein